VQLAGARIGVIGTGSSAVQMVCALVDTVGQLRLFQRTAQCILAVPNPPIDEEDRARYRADPATMVELRRELGSGFVEAFANAVVDASSPQLKPLQNLARANLEDHVSDLVLREKLRPDYQAGCKRLIISANFYDAIQRPNARLVTERILRVERGGLRTVDGELHELDVLVLATGFRVDRFLRPIEVVGRGGIPARRILGAATVRVHGGVGAGLSEPVHAQRPERARRQLLTHRRRRSPVHLPVAAHRPSGSGRVPRSLRKPSGDGPLRDGTGRGGQDHGVGDRLP
jgi:cation diffusion facilitator CzcD-associated flavoprotein CzcO